MTHHALTAPATLALAAVGSYTYVSSSIICSSSGTGITLTARRVLWLCFRSLHHPHFAYAYVVSVSCNRPSALAPLFVVFAMFSLCMSGCKSCQRNCNNILVCGSCSLSFRPPCVNSIAKIIRGLCTVLDIDTLVPITLLILFGSPSTCRATALSADIHSARPEGLD